MRYVLLTLTLSLFLLQFAYADTVYNQGIYSGTVFSIGSDNYTILGIGNGGGDYPNNYTNMVVKKISGGILNVMASQGACSSQGFYDFCFDGVSYDFTNNLSRGTEGLRPMIDLRIEHYADSITYARPTTTYANYNVPTDVGMSFTNQNPKSINVQYTEDVPAALEILSTYNCTFYGNRLSNTFPVGTNPTTFGYALKVKDYGNWTWHGHYSYTLDGNNVSIDGPDMTFSVNDAYLLTDSISKTTVSYIGESYEYDIMLDNIDEQNYMHAYLTVYSSNAHIVSYDNLVFNNSYYYYDNDISPNHNVTLKIFARADSIGNESFMTNAIIDVNGHRFIASTNKSLILNAAGLSAYIVADKENITPNDVVNVWLILNNTDINDYYYINGVLSGFNSTYVSYTGIGHGSFAVIKNTYVVPNLQNGSLNISFKGNYKTSNNQDQSLYTDYIFNIVNSTYSAANNANANLPGNVQNNIGNTSQNTTTKPNDANSGNSAAVQEPPQQDNTPSQPSSSTASDTHKDFLTTIFDALSNFLSHLFGKK